MNDLPSPGVLQKQKEREREEAAESEGEESEGETEAETVVTGVKVFWPFWRSFSRTLAQLIDRQLGPERGTGRACPNDASCEPRRADCLLPCVTHSFFLSCALSMMAWYVHCCSCTGSGRASAVAM